jgi:hypothetical protein
LKAVIPPKAAGRLSGKIVCIGIWKIQANAREVTWDSIQLRPACLDPIEPRILDSSDVPFELPVNDVLRVKDRTVILMLKNWGWKLPVIE